MSLEACAPVSTGSGFLKGTLAYLDCAGQTIGSVGFSALSQPGSIMSRLLLTIITLFIAWHGIRLMFGRPPRVSDAVVAAAKIGLVVMLMTSWPAVRTIFAAPSFAGSAELVSETQLAAFPIEDRLQQVDDGIVALTKWGTGKLDIRVGTTVDGEPAATEFSGIALTDNLALGLGRLCYLLGAIISIGLLKLLAGIMVSALPIFAGLLLFDSLRGLFAGWLRLMLALFVAGFAVPLILSAELSLIEPWLASAISARSGALATPSAPTELLAISGSFLLILIGTIALIGKACFALDFARVADRVERMRQDFLPAAQEQRERPPAAKATGAATQLSRAEALALTLGRQEQLPRGQLLLAGPGYAQRAHDQSPEIGAGRSAPGTALRRARQRAALSHQRRNQQ